MNVSPINPLTNQLDRKEVESCNLPVSNTGQFKEWELKPNVKLKFNTVIKNLVQFSDDLSIDQLRSFYNCKNINNISYKCEEINKQKTEILNISKYISELNDCFPYEDLIKYEQTEKQLVNYLISAVAHKLPPAQQLSFDPVVRELAGIEILRNKNKAKFEAELKELKPSEFNSEENLDIIARKCLLEISETFTPEEKDSFEREVTRLIENNTKRFSKSLKEYKNTARTFILEDSFSSQMIAALASNIHPQNFIHELQRLSPKKLLQLLQAPEFNSFKNTECIYQALKPKFKAIHFTDEGDKFLESILDSKLPPEKKLKLFEAISKGKRDLFECLKLLLGFTTPPIHKVFRFFELLKPDETFFHKIDPFYLSNSFVQLMVLDPTYSLELLRNPKYKLKDIKFADFYTRIIAKMPLEKESDLAQCFSILSTNPTFKIENIFENEFQKIIQNDLPELAYEILKNFGQQINKDNIFMMALQWDSIKCFKSIINLWKTDWDFNKARLIDFAVTFKATKCLEYLVSTFGIDETHKMKIAEEASKEGAAEILIAVCNQNKQESVKLLFSDITPLPENSSETEIKERTILLGDKILRILRFNPIDTCDELFKLFLNGCSDSEKKLYQKIYAENKSAFLEKAPFFARNVKPHELIVTQSFYQANLNDKKMVENDYAYGASCRSDALNLLKILQSGENLNSPFPQLPPSKYNTKRAAFLLERIANIRFKTQIERGQYESSFGQIREEKQSKTPIVGRYQWAEPLVWAVYKYSKAPDLEKSYDQFNLLYQGKKLNMTYCIPIWSMMSWFHGLQPLIEAWGNIENAFEDVMRLDLSKPKSNTPEAQKAYEARLTEFYSKTAELVWLIGNTQPLYRGSGTVAEWLLALVHLHHGLQPPVLKTEFPQLDVLDITFPLSDYKKFFTYFFEQSTIPEHMRRPKLSGPLIDQMKQLYELNTSKSPSKGTNCNI